MGRPVAMRKILPALNRRFCFLLAPLCLVVFGTQVSYAQGVLKNPVTWWPDPSTGLMWMGQEQLYEMYFRQASDYCGSLKLGGYTGWRLPTLDEVMAATEEQFNPRYQKNTNYVHYNFLVFKGGVRTWDRHKIWTSTPDGAHQVDVVVMGRPAIVGNYFDVNYPQYARQMAVKKSEQHTTVCTRVMEDDLRQIATNAQVDSAVPDVQTLKAYALVAKAQQAYADGNYQEALAKAQSALQIKPNFAPADWVIGMSDGMLGQWNLAVFNLEATLKIDKSYRNAKDSLKWAKEGLEAAKKGESPPAPGPDLK
jgi:tetratricopeptide (TPR) repeat protein